MRRRAQKEHESLTLAANTNNPANKYLRTRKKDTKRIGITRRTVREFLLVKTTRNLRAEEKTGFAFTDRTSTSRNGQNKEPKTRRAKRRCFFVSIATVGRWVSAARPLWEGYGDGSCRLQVARTRCRRRHGQLSYPNLRFPDCTKLITCKKLRGRLVDLGSSTCNQNISLNIELDPLWWWCVSSTRILQNVFRWIMMLWLFSSNTEYFQRTRVQNSY